MSSWKLSTPVGLLIFNRPETTARIFEAIRQAAPPRLLIVADGPRVDRVNEAERCRQTREIVKRIDWPCEVLTNFSVTNLGCKVRVATGIDWIFENCEEAIILEDDCLPDASFFRFCEELLIRYRDDEQVGMISGGNLQFGRVRGDASYYFSRYTHIWGWASWRRAWQHYDRDISFWPTLRDTGWLEKVFDNPGERQYWRHSFDAVHDGKLDTWDCSWTLSSLVRGMLQIVPNVNLISNIGFGPNATHTHEVGVHANLPLSPMVFPMRHPADIVVDVAADLFITDEQIAPSFLKRQLRRLKRYIFFWK